MASDDFNCKTCGMDVSPLYGEDESHAVKIIETHQIPYSIEQTTPSGTGWTAEITCPNCGSKPQVEDQDI